MIENKIEILIDRLLIYKDLSQRLIKRHIEGVCYELKATSIFYEIGGDGTLPKGCGSLYITEPSLNRAVREMEKELGIQLFEKRGRNIFLNKYGHLFLPYVKRSLQELERGVDLMKLIRARIREKLRWDLFIPWAILWCRK